MERARSWAVRCVHEAQLHERNAFITLTYDQEHVPATGSVDVRHWQLFAKRLRKRCGAFRFFHCGEYGSENFRPHYHAILFGIDFSEDRTVFERKPEYTTWVSPTLDEVWGKGFSTIGSVSFQSACYVARYIMKKVGGPAAEEHYRRIDLATGEEYQVKPEYVTMSRRPGLGARWLEKYRDDVYPDDECIVGGHKYRPPVFYDREVEKMDPAFMKGVRAARVKRALEFGEDQTPERLLVREKVSDARLSQLPRVI